MKGYQALTGQHAVSKTAWQQWLGQQSGGGLDGAGSVLGPPMLEDGQQPCHVGAKQLEPYGSKQRWQATGTMTMGRVCPFSRTQHD
jgi:hypothetical protein